jgi:two-component system chemotaxis response regulator CheY
MKTHGGAAGASGWLVIPFDPKKLLEVVKKVIG